MNWPSTVGLRVDEAGKLAVVAASQGEGRGEAHFLFGRTGPGSPNLVGELFRPVEQHLAVSVPGAPSIRRRPWEGYRRAWGTPVRDEDKGAAPHRRFRLRQPTCRLGLARALIAQGGRRAWVLGAPVLS